MVQTRGGGRGGAGVEARLQGGGGGAGGRSLINTLVVGAVAALVSELATNPTFMQARQNSV